MYTYLVVFVGLSLVTDGNLLFRKELVSNHHQKHSKIVNE